MEPAKLIEVTDFLDVEIDGASKGAGLNSGEVDNGASKKVVVFGGRGGMRGDDFVAKDILFEAEDVQMGANYSMPSIKFSKQVHKLLEDNMKNTTVVKFLGRKIGFNTLFNMGLEIWRSI
ncbi:hypothetical protein PVK06_038366 [Gossypium arboreum]|uniref:Uncharacterized protein n=1 Tax=Gossypium arboreum TaxID=29729 RepID=A0ABR0N0C2_GOSAR|nr:hypothetical protein PVK06_038366 [Gossypium arboreum]